MTLKFDDDCVYKNYSCDEMITSRYNIYCKATDKKTQFYSVCACVSVRKYFNNAFTLHVYYTLHQTHTAGDLSSAAHTAGQYYTNINV